MTVLAPMDAFLEVKENIFGHTVGPRDNPRNNLCSVLSVGPALVELALEQIPFAALAASFTVRDCLRPVSSTPPHCLARAWGFVLLRVAACIDMNDVGALVGWGLRAVGRHVDFVWFVDDDDFALSGRNGASGFSVDNAQTSGRYLGLNHTKRAFWSAYPEYI